MKQIHRFAQAVVILALALLVSPKGLEAQRLVDNWATQQECEMARSAPFYYPTMKRAQRLTANEKIAGSPANACIEMDLPDRDRRRGFVKIEAGRQLVYRNGEINRLLECNNRIYKFVPLYDTPQTGLPGVTGQTGQIGPQGPKGDKGDPGQNGTNTISSGGTNLTPLWWFLGLLATASAGCQFLTDNFCGMRKETNVDVYQETNVNKSRAALIRLPTSLLGGYNR